MTDQHDVGPRRPPTAHGFSRTYTVRGPLAPLIGLLVLAPALLAVVSLAALLVGGGALAALVLPALLRHRARQAVPPGDRDTIELDHDQYRHVDVAGSEGRRE